MTRKDYVLIARAIKQSKNQAVLLELDAIRYTAENIATELQGDNGNFNKEKFLTACGV